ncbi:hypothetical protein J2Z40_003768 [Cytobacillus eiseniae]|uniref:Uncharacterized protein n=1 Tax=Cytobacillus eiseniae TaxID=762947 RepID=A0ABS4RLD7_9BACI|nr:hypothetical protein [Cytobacillus eiseniae]MBP2243180.1 hypothetical protein [Cytobacillus eiseniae]
MNERGRVTITVISLAGYGLITEDFKFQPYMMLFISLTLLVTGSGIKRISNWTKRLWLAEYSCIYIYFICSNQKLLNEVTATFLNKGCCLLFK